MKVNILASCQIRLFKGVFHQVNFSNLTNVFVSVIVIPLNLVIRVSFAFFGIKSDRIIVTKLVPILDGIWDCVNSVMAAYLLKVHF